MYKYPGAAIEESLLSIDSHRGERNGCQMVADLQPHQEGYCGNTGGMNLRTDGVSVIAALYACKCLPSHLRVVR